MSFLLPGIYKPFYIEGIMVRKTRNTFFTLIDIHNGVGLYDPEKELYNIGTIKCDFIIQRNVGNTLSSVTYTSKNSIVYREKPLFSSNYQDSINSVFSKTTYSYAESIDLKGVKISYTPPLNTYGVELNRKIDLEIRTNGLFSRTYATEDSYVYDAQFCLLQSADNQNAFSIYQGENSYTYEGKLLEPDENFIPYVSGSTNGIKYYVVNESFYKNYIDPDTLGEMTSQLYRTYNNGEINNFKNNDIARVFCDLFPHKIVYNSSYFPTNNAYDTEKYCCVTSPFFRMYPQIKSNDANFPLCREVKYISTNTPVTIDLNRPIEKIGTQDLSEVKFYLIGVKSPLTILPSNLYVDALSGKQLKPEQDYITIIENYGRLKIISSDETSLYTNDGVAKRYNNTIDFRL